MASGSEISSRESSPEGDEPIALGKRLRRQPKYLESYTNESTSMKDSKLVLQNVDTVHIREVA